MCIRDRDVRAGHDLRCHEGDCRLSHEEMTKRMIVAALALAGVFIALYLLLYKLGMIGHLSCNIGSCETVNTSKWARLMGIPVAGWGLAFYAALFVLAMVSTGEHEQGCVEGQS